MKTCRGLGFVLAVAFALTLFSRGRPNAAVGGSSSQQTEEGVCDPLADYFLGMEDYPEAIRRHQLVIKEHPENALAHYHLGFSYGMLGEHQQEFEEYEQAVNLGLDDWQLFLNLGLLYLETGNVNDATKVLKLATLLGPSHAETHFNLALAYQRMGEIQPAEQEVLLAIQIDPNQPDARNMLGTLYAQEGKCSRAQDEWSELAESDPSYSPARQNLVILHQTPPCATQLESETADSASASKPHAAESGGGETESNLNQSGESKGSANLSGGLADEP